MEFLKNIFNPTKKNETQEIVKNLHPNFKITEDNFWYFNRKYTGVERKPTVKAIFKFDDATSLDDCSFLTKIGINQSDGPKYFGVSFGDDSNRLELENWVKKFTWAHLITELDENGIMQENGEEIDLKLEN